MCKFAVKSYEMPCTYTEHTSTMHLSKSGYTISICEMLRNDVTCTEHTSTMSPELMKLRIMIISNKTKVLVKFGTSEMMCVELRAKKL